MSRWTLDAPREACWAVLADPALSWPTWWPGMSGEVVGLGDGDGDGSRARLSYRAPLGYTLRIGLHARRVEPPSGARFDVSGDLVGTGVVTLASASPRRAAPAVLDVPGAPTARTALTVPQAMPDEVTVVTILWDVRTTRPWMNALAPVLGGAFAWAHERVLRDGERGLRAHLAVGGDVAPAAPPARVREA